MKPLSAVLSLLLLLSFFQVYTLQPIEWLGCDFDPCMCIYSTVTGIYCISFTFFCILCVFPFLCTVFAVCCCFKCFCFTSLTVFFSFCERQKHEILLRLMRGNFRHRNNYKIDELLEPSRTI